MTISKGLLDERLKGCERPEDLLGDAGLTKELRIRLMERMLGAALTAHPLSGRALPGRALRGNVPRGCVTRTARMHPPRVSPTGVTAHSQQAPEGPGRRGTDRCRAIPLPGRACLHAAEGPQPGGGHGKR
jgi:putative transposase